MKNSLYWSSCLVGAARAESVCPHEVILTILIDWFHPEKMNHVFFVLKDMRHQKSGVWAVEEGFFCLRTSVSIRMRLAQHKVDALYNMFLPLCCRICFHRSSYLWTKLSCSVRQSMTLFLSSEGCCFWLHQWQFALGWSYQSFSLRNIVGFDSLFILLHQNLPIFRGSPNCSLCYSLH